MKLSCPTLIKISFIIFFLALSNRACAETGREIPLTLRDCYLLALKQSESIAINKEVIKEAEAHFLQALGEFLPHLNFSLTRDNADAAQIGTPRNTSEHKFIVQQMLFSGFKEFAAITGSKLERKQRIHELVRAKQLLFADVAEAFYLLMDQRQELKTMQSVNLALGDRIKELEKRVALGRSRRSEVVNTQVQFYSVRADIELIKRREEIARQLLEFLTGRKISDIIDNEPTVPFLKDEEAYLTKLSDRPDLLAAQKAWEVAKKAVIVARSPLFPSVNLQAEWYTYRNTAPTNSRWDAELAINIPIFEGTETYGQIKEAQAQAREKELQLQQLKRSALQDIKDAYVNVKTALLRTRALKAAQVLSKINYSLQLQDYRFNLVNNLDVLQAVRDMEDNQRSFLQSFYEAKGFYAQLLAAIGEVIQDNDNIK